MNQIQSYKHSFFGELPVALINNKENFGAQEAASMLGYANPHDAIAKHCKKDGVAFCEVIDSLGRVQKKKFISEGNLYRLITRSKLPDAERFEKWVFDHLLPTIRKNGAYMTPETIEQALTNPDFIIGLATKLKEEQAAKRLALEEKEKAEKLIELQRPKVVYAEAVTVSEDTVLVKDLATTLKQKGINIGPVRLFEWLRENGYLCKQKGDNWNMPTQRSLDLGVIAVKHGLRAGSDGEMRKTRTPKITGKGQIYFVNKFMSFQNAI